MIQLFVQNGNKIDTGGAQDRERDLCSKLFMSKTTHFHDIVTLCSFSCNTNRLSPFPADFSATFLILYYANYSNTK
jgi:hypothetical protein